MEFLVLGTLVNKYLVKHIESCALVVGEFLTRIALEHTADELASKVDEGDRMHTPEMVVQVEPHLIGRYHRRAVG